MLEKLKNLKDEVLKEVKVWEEGDYVYIVNPNHFEITVFIKSSEAREIVNFLKSFLQKR